MKNSKIGFIGGGNMARSLIGGLIADGTNPQQIWVSDPNATALSELEANCGIHGAGDNNQLIEAADVVVLAVKPQMLHEVCNGIVEAVQAKRPLIVSIAAGVRSAEIERWLGGNLPVVRTMPNTPSLVQSGATALFANPRVNSSQRELAEALLRAVGLTLWLEEETQMDAVTAISGSGPAYFFLVMEAMEQAGTRLGLPADTARLLTLQTAFGAAKMALESSDDAATLRARVTSPGGTTERAIETLQQGELIALFERALTAARDRSSELADMFGESS